MEEGEEIVHVTHSFYPVVGGIEKAIYETARRQARKYKVTVITSSYVPEYNFDNINVIRVKSLRFLNMPDLTIPLQRINLYGRNAIFHFHSQNSLFSYSLLKKANNVFTLMAIDSLKSHPNFLIRFFSPLYSSITMKKVLKLSNKLIVKNKRDFNLLKEKYGREAYLVPDGIDDLFFTQPKDYSFKDKIGSDYVLYIGRLHPLKGVDLLIKASKYINAKIVFIGPGNIEYYMKFSKAQHVEEKCVFLNFVDDKTKISAIDSAEAVVIPSLSDYVEAFSIVLSEAWSREKPVIASNVGSLKYRIKNNENGILVEPNERELANAINYIIENKEVGRKLGVKGRENINSWDEVVQMLEKIYWG
ncbi:glycosyltransferase family 4 protein [Acidianus manzaensis]|uniref:Glycosyl transferase family 1 n=1 Tax=Acidianus manzaensis TaxID=282676 RepID=A0A1W6JWQ1_9CREN|nr:glycosyltransferase family 4 protein [Acidianus manzaensis]ARM74644.1 glycosyl transferase family 1 [Acidianus manzaensis]